VLPGEVVCSFPQPPLLVIDRPAKWREDGAVEPAEPLALPVGAIASTRVDPVCVAQPFGEREGMNAAPAGHPEHLGRAWLDGDAIDLARLSGLRDHHQRLAILDRPAVAK